MDHQHKIQKLNDIILPKNDGQLFFKKFENSMEDIRNLTRLHTEAGALNDHLFSVGQSITRKCRYCRCRETFDHFMNHCPRFASLRGRLILDDSYEVKADYICATGSRI